MILLQTVPSGARFGGAAANFSCHSARLGAKVHTVSGIGSDDRGKRALKELKNHGVCTEQSTQLPAWLASTKHVMTTCLPHSSVF